MLLGDGEKHKVVMADCIEHMDEMPENSIDCAIMSVPFPAMYSYTSMESDIGNSEDRGEMKLHFGFFYRKLAKVLKPGRVAAVHVMQIPRMKRSGGDGLFDFRGFNIRIGERAGLVYHYDWTVRKAPQAQAIRTKSRSLQFSGLEADRSQSRGALADYVIKFKKPGENRVKINSEGDVTRNQWIEWAECSWDDIRETDTLNVKEARGDEDTKHLCPLQLPLIKRLVKLYTNPDEIVFDPFGGVGSSGYCALLLGRRFYGCELKKEYYETAQRNLARAEELAKEQVQQELFHDVAQSEEAAAEQQAIDQMFPDEVPS